MSFRDDLMPLLDDVRSIPGELGLRPFRLFVRTKTWTGERPGLGLSTTTEVEVLTGGHPPKVRELEHRDIISGAPHLKRVEYRVGPIQPDYPLGGHTTEELDPEQSTTPTEVLYRLTGPGLPADGLLCEKVSDDFVANLHRELTLRAIGRTGA